MKNSTKAILVAIFVFPGAGYFILRKTKTALFVIAISVLVLCVLMSSIVEITWNIVNQVMQKGEIPNYQMLYNSIQLEIANSDLLLINGPFFVLLFIWIASIVDTWRQSRKFAS